MLLRSNIHFFPSAIAFKVTVLLNCERSGGLSLWLQVITRVRPDANLQYIYNSPQKQGRGRRYTNGGKVNVKNINKRKWKRCYEDDHIEAFELILKFVTLKRKVKVVYPKYKKGN